MVFLMHQFLLIYIPAVFSTKELTSFTCLKNRFMLILKTVERVSHPQIVSVMASGWSTAWGQVKREHKGSLYMLLTDFQGHQSMWKCQTVTEMSLWLHVAICLENVYTKWGRQRLGRTESSRKKWMYGSKAINRCERKAETTNSISYVTLTVH